MKVTNDLCFLKGTVPRDFRLLVFFHESVSPKPLSIPLGPFRIVSKIGGDIHSSRLTTGVVDTTGHWKNQKIFNNFVGTPLDSRVNIYIHFCFQVHFKVSAAWYCSHCFPPVLLTPATNLLPVSLTPVANLPPVSTTLVKLVAKFAAGVVDTAGKFATSVVDTGGAPWLANISTNFQKNLKRS